MPDRSFYGTAASLIPTLLLVVTVQGGLLSRGLPDSALTDWVRSGSPTDDPPRKWKRRHPWRALLLLVVGLPEEDKTTLRERVIAVSLVVAGAAEMAALIGVAYYPHGGAGIVLAVLAWGGLTLIVPEVLAGIAVTTLALAASPKRSDAQTEMAAPKGTTSSE